MLRSVLLAGWVILGFAEGVMGVNPLVGIIGRGSMGTVLSGRLIDADVPVIGLDIDAVSQPLSARQVAR